MRNRYDRMEGKESQMANHRQKRLEAEHSEKNSFVKRQEEELSKYGGKAPDLKEEAMEFNAYMCNNGHHAQELAREVTSNIDHVAFPVKPAMPK